MVRLVLLDALKVVLSIVLLLVQLNVIVLVLLSVKTVKTLVMLPKEMLFIVDKRVLVVLAMWNVQWLLYFINVMEQLLVQIIMQI